MCANETQRRAICCAQSHIFWPESSIFCACNRKEGNIFLQREQKDWEAFLCIQFVCTGVSSTRLPAVHAVFLIEVLDLGHYLLIFAAFCTLEGCPSSFSVILLFFFSVWDSLFFSFIFPTYSSAIATHIKPSMSNDWNWRIYKAFVSRTKWTVCSFCISS